MVAYGRGVTILIVLWATGQKFIEVFLYKIFTALSLAGARFLLVMIMLVQLTKVEDYTAGEIIVMVN